MKKNILMFMLIIFLSINAFSQVKLGLNIGMNFSSHMKDEHIFTENKTRKSFSLGGQIEINLIKYISFITTPMYLEKGFIDNSEIQEYEMKISYFELPLMVKISYPLKKFQPYLKIGPSFGFLLDTNFYKEHIHIKNIDYGLGLCCGLSIPTGGFIIFIEGNYIFSLNNLLDNIVWTGLYEPVYKNRSILLITGFSIPIKMK